MQENLVFVAYLNLLRIFFTGVITWLSGLVCGFFKPKLIPTPSVMDRETTVPLIELYKWIVHFFITNRSHWSVTAIYLCVIRKCEKLGLNAAY